MKNMGLYVNMSQGYSMKEEQVDLEQSVSKIVVRMGRKDGWIKWLLNDMVTHVNMVPPHVTIKRDFFHCYFLLKPLLNQSYFMPLKSPKEGIFVLIHNQAWAIICIYFLVSFKYLQLRVFHVLISYKQMFFNVSI